MDKLKKFLLFIKEGYKIEDKVILLKYFIKYLLSKLLGVKNSMYSNKKLIIKNNSGLFYCGHSINNAWIVSRFHEPEMKKYLDIKKGVFLDIGANIGKHSIEVGNKNPNVKIISVEPEPSNFKILKENIKLNKINNIILENIGIGLKNSKMNLYLSESTAEHSIKNKTSRKIEINVMTLDSLLKKHNISKVDLIKIDVEGAEYDVLLGAKKTLASHPKILFEARTNKELNNIKKLLKQFNYKIKEIFKENYLAY